MRSSRPYITRALYEWLLDNANTPYIVVDAMKEDVVVPTQFIQNGQIVLNVGPNAVRDLDIGNETLSFHASFSGQPMQVWVPMDALVAIYSRESGAGMVFGQEPVMPPSEEGGEEEEYAGHRVKLESVPGKQNERDDDTTLESEGGDGDDTPPDGGGSKPRKRPALRVIK